MAITANVSGTNKSISHAWVNDGNQNRKVANIWVGDDTDTPRLVFSDNEVFFTSNGVFVVPDNIFSITVTAIAGGGSGAQGYCQNVGAGGGGGGRVINQVYAVTPGQVINITVGAGGVWGPVGDNQRNASGGSTVLSGLVTLTGGQGAGWMSANPVYGTGGSPNGTNGSQGQSYPMDSQWYPGANGGAGYTFPNGTTYGGGGNGGNGLGYLTPGQSPGWINQYSSGNPGQQGAVLIRY